MSNVPSKNRLLRQLSAIDVDLLGSLEEVDLPVRTPLETAGRAIDFAHFVEDGVISVVMDGGQKPIEVGLIGHEGMTGAGIALGDVLSPFDTYPQVAGSGLRVETGRLITALAASATLRMLLGRYNRALAIQIATTASANGGRLLEQRLARWLLMVADRTGPSFQITHEFIAIMLAVRRAGVSIAIAELEGVGLIRALRGSITILDRAGLEAASNGGYGFAEREYERLISA